MKGTGTVSEEWRPTSASRQASPTRSPVWHTLPIVAAVIAVVAITSACGPSVSPAVVACGRLEQAECHAAVDLATDQLPSGHPPIERTAADFLCAPGNPCQAGFRVAVAFGFGADREAFGVLVSGVQAAETAVPLEGAIPDHILSLLGDAAQQT